MKLEKSPIEICEIWDEEITSSLSSIMEEIHSSGRINETTEDLIRRSSELRRVALLMDTVAILMTVKEMTPACPKCGWNQITNSYKEY
jgi:hypothetical protein